MLVRTWFKERPNPVGARLRAHALHGKDELKFMTGITDIPGFRYMLGRLANTDVRFLTATDSTADNVRFGS